MPGNAVTRRSYTGTLRSRFFPKGLASLALQAQRFMATVLLPHVRQDIRANRRLHFALFQALKKATYKPDAFYKVREAHDSASQVLFQEHQSAARGHEPPFPQSRETRHAGS